MLILQIFYSFVYIKLQEKKTKYCCVIRERTCVYISNEYLYIIHINTILVSQSHGFTVGTNDSSLPVWTYLNMLKWNMN